MTFIQVTLCEPEGVVSGVGLRNQSIFQNLLKLAEGRTLSLSADTVRKHKSNRGHPTVSTLDQNALDQLFTAIKLIKPDFIIFEGVPLLEAVVAVGSAFPKIKLIADFHNVESHLLKQLQVAQLPAFLQFTASILFAGSRNKARNADETLVSLVDQIWTCSPEDTVLLRELTATKPIHIIANAIPAWCSNPGPVQTRVGRQILFVGHLGYKPNKQAVRELCNQIFPAVRRQISDATVHIAGRNPGRRISNAIQLAGGRLSKNPAELSPIYEQAAVMVVPLRSGGGTRIKILEALAVGLPIVATRKAVEGLGLQNGVHFFEAETTAEFAAAIETMFLHPHLGQKMAESGQKMAFAKFGSDAILACLTTAISGLPSASTENTAGLKPVA